MSESRKTVPSGPPAAVLEARRRGELLVSREAVERAMDRLAIRMSLRLHDRDPLLLVVMHGALPFAGALLPRLDFPLQVSHVHVGRYGDATRGGTLHWLARPDQGLAGRTVVLVDDVLDRGETLAELTRWVTEAGAAEVLSAVLVDKALPGPRPVVADFVALECPDRYLFGWGMDFRGYWRNLPAIYALPDDLVEET
ncbi:MAG: hypoxanthine-guanine phosphoribosyltransferase [Pseudomonadota bacterium]